MSDWSSGYVADIGYSFGYCPDLNPLRLKLAFLNAGLDFPSVHTACELGFGQGISVNVHAAASTSQWFATDFNPSHARFAQRLAKASGAKAQLFDQAFADFCRRDDLPDFDYIGLHGIWSWISDENRQVIVDFIGKKLKVGGVLCISYNSMPGWAAMVPMRDLLTEHAEVMGVSGQGIVSRIDGALGFAERLLATNPGYRVANPQVTDRLERLKGHKRNYLAHEYFNRDWAPMSFARMAKWLAPTKASFACSAHFLDHLATLNLSVKQQALLNEIPDPMFRQTVNDFCVNQQFRRDYWVKGPSRLAGPALGEALGSQRIMLVQPRAEVSLKVNGPQGEATMEGRVYEPFLDFLADFQPRTLIQIEAGIRSKNVTFSQILQATIALIGTGAVAPVQDELDIAGCRGQTQKLNAFLCDMARSGTEVSTLASPVTGGGVSASRISQLFLHARNLGKSQPAEWADFVWRIMSAQKQMLLREGKPLASAEDNLAELNSLGDTFAKKHLPLFQALGVAD